MSYARPAVSSTGPEVCSLSQSSTQWSMTGRPSRPGPAGEERAGPPDADVVGPPGGGLQARLQVVEVEGRIEGGRLEFVEVEGSRGGLEVVVAAQAFDDGVRIAVAGRGGRGGAGAGQQTEYAERQDERGDDRSGGSDESRT